jgi:peptidoglycan LD-endopeptidase CwlK
MFTGIIVAYFALACLALAWLVFPQSRQAVAGWWRARRFLPGLSGGRSWWWALAMALMLLLPPVVVLWWGTQVPSARTLDAYDDATATERHPLVADLLRGEQLVPPPPLPPEVFTTAEVEVVRPMLSTADRRWEQMDPEFVQRLLLLIKVMKEEHGYDVTLLEGYRSPERQSRLAAMGGHVTNAGAWQSYHQYGLGADCAFLRDGKLVITEKDPWAMRGYELYGQVAERLGLVWGGRWRLMDFGHVEWRKPGVKLGNTR